MQKRLKTNAHRLPNSTTKRVHANSRNRKRNKKQKNKKETENNKAFHAQFQLQIFEI